jgi:hypothetical protein
MRDHIMWGHLNRSIPYLRRMPYLCLALLLGCGGNAGGTNERDDGGDKGGGPGAMTAEDPASPECTGTPEVVPPETPFLVNIRQQSYIVGPEGGTFDLTDKPAVTISIPPCAVDEPVRFSYGISFDSGGVSGAEGATTFIGFLTIPARVPGNSGYVGRLRGDVTLTWHDAPEPERAKIWAMGLRGYEPRSTNVEGSDVRASTPLVTYLDFALGE